MKALLVSFGLALVAASLSGQANTTPAKAADYFWGQKATSVVNAAGSSQFWFYLDAYQGRSYCVEAGNSESSTGDKLIDPIVVVFRADHTTEIVDNDDALEEPSGSLLARACWVHTFPSDRVYVLLLPNAPSLPAGAVTLRFLETTLYCPWFFIAGDYNAFSLIRNTSLTDLPGVVITWRGLGGAVAGTTTVTIPGSGTAIVNARDFVDAATFSNGSVEITHPGGPDQIQASTTTLSGTTGLGFDAAFAQRRPW